MDLYSTFIIQVNTECNLSDFALDLTAGETIDLIEMGFDKAYIAASDELFSLIKDGTLDLVLAPGDLRIKTVVRPGVDISTIDFTLLDLVPETWTFSRGARNSRVYNDKNGVPVIIDIYTYNYVDEGRSVDGYTREIRWLNTEGEVGLTKDTSGVIDKKRLKQLNRDLRQGRMDYLEASAEELRDVAELVELTSPPIAAQYRMIADSIDVLFSHYSVPVADYISRGTLSFETLVLGETSPQIVGILAIPSSPPSPAFPMGLNVKTSILYQLRGWIAEPGDTPGY